MSVLKLLPTHQHLHQRFKSLTSSSVAEEPAPPPYSLLHLPSPQPTAPPSQSRSASWHPLLYLQFVILLLKAFKLFLPIIRRLLPTIARPLRALRKFSHLREFLIQFLSFLDILYVCILVSNMHTGTVGCQNREHTAIEFAAAIVDFITVILVGRVAFFGYILQSLEEIGTGRGGLGAVVVLVWYLVTSVDRGNW